MLKGCCVAIILQYDKVLKLTADAKFGAYTRSYICILCLNEFVYKLTVLLTSLH